MIWRLECLTVALSAALLFVGCSDGDGPINGGDNGSPEVLGSIDAPLFVYEILAERVSADSVGIDILDLLSEPRVEQLLMNHVPEEVAVVQAKHEAAAAFGVDSVQLATDSGAVMLAVSAMVLAMIWICDRLISSSTFCSVPDWFSMNMDTCLIVISLRKQSGLSKQFA